MGDGSLCTFPPLPELTCKAELPCDADLPLVEFGVVTPGIQVVNIEWVGLLATDQVEILITGKFVDLYVKPLESFYELNDYELLPDVDAPDMGSTVMGVFVVDRVYTISIRRVRDGKVSLWNSLNTVGVADEHTYIIDGVDIIVDDYLDVGTRIAPIPIIDDEVP